MVVSLNESVVMNTHFPFSVVKSCVHLFLNCLENWPKLLSGYGYFGHLFFPHLKPIAMIL